MSQLNCRRMLAPIQALGVAALALWGCYDGQANPDAAATLSVSTSTGALVADGTTTVPITIAVEADTPASTVIDVAVSSGTIDFGADAKDAAARRLQVKNDGTGALTIPWRLGTQAGPAVIQVVAAGVSRWAQVTLAPSQPDEISFSVDRTSISADGSVPIQATVSLRISGAKGLVSDNTLVRFVVCCAASAGDPIPCASAPPFLVAPEATTAPGEQSLTTKVLVSDATVKPQTAVRGWLVADSGGHPTCPATPGHVTSTIAIQISP